MRKNHVFVNCRLCDKLVKRKLSVIKKSKTDNFFCSRQCTTNYHKKIHGMSYTIFYKKWWAMVQRCKDINHKKYKDYGGRGIKVCKKWKNFCGFMDDMYDSYLKHEERNKHTTLGRIDNDGHYCLENCRWENMKQQNANRRNSRLFSFNGMRMNIRDWSYLIGITENTLWSRIYRGWTIKKTLTTKPN